MLPKGCINVDVLHGQALVSDIRNKACELQLFWWAASSYESAIDDLFSRSSADKSEVFAFPCAETKLALLHVDSQMARKMWTVWQARQHNHFYRLTTIFSGL